MQCKQLDNRSPFENFGPQSIMSNPNKERQYAHMAQQLQLLQSNLVKTAGQLEIMSRQCNKNLVGQLGKVHASWFIGSNRYFEEEMLGKQKK